MNVFEIPAFSDNYIWVVQARDPHRVAVVDPGDAAAVIAACQRRAWRPAAILITHHHNDHVGGVARLVEHYGCPVYGPARERIPCLTHLLADGAVVELSDVGVRFVVLDVPGHTAGHIAYYGEEALFCGDTLFTAGCGRLFEGTAPQMHASLERLASLPEHTLVYCAHEYTLDNLRFALTVEPANPEILARREDSLRLLDQDRPTVPSTLALERRTNPFLRSTEPKVVSAAEAFAGRALRDPAEVFATVRHWKDTLD